MSNIRKIILITVNDDETDKYSDNKEVWVAELDINELLHALEPFQTDGYSEVNQSTNEVINMIQEELGDGEIYDDN